MRNKEELSLYDFLIASCEFYGKLFSEDKDARETITNFHQIWEIARKKLFPLLLDMQHQIYEFHFMISSHHGLCVFLNLFWRQSEEIYDKILSNPSFWDIFGSMAD